MWKRGDPLSAKNLNQKTANIAHSGSNRGSLASSSRAYDKHLVFRQEGQSINDADFFPTFFAPRAFNILGCFGFCDTGGEFEASLQITTNAYTDFQILYYTDAEVGDDLLVDDIVAFVSRGDQVKLQISNPVDLANFQLYVMIQTLS